MAASRGSSPGIIRLARVAGILAGLVFCGCSGGPSARSPAELARQLAEFEATVNALAPACTTMVGPEVIIENCRFVKDGKLSCFRSHISESNGAVGEMSYWYKDDRPWAARTWSRKPAPTPNEPWKETSLDAYFDGSGHVVWAEMGRDGQRKAIADRRLLAWLERNTLKAAQSELDDARERRSGR